MCVYSNQHFNIIQTMVSRPFRFLIGFTVVSILTVNWIFYHHNSVQPKFLSNSVDKTHFIRTTIKPTTEQILTQPPPKQTNQLPQKEDEKALLNSNKNLPSYPTRAIQDLYEQHNHLLLQSHLFYGRLNSSKVPPSSQVKDNRLCVVVLASNRVIPYVDILLYMLSQGNSPQQLSASHIHVLNVEQRQHKQQHNFLHNIIKLGYVQVHATPPNHTDSYQLSQIKSYRKAAKICDQAQTKWCVILEDDVIVPASFLALFHQHVAQSLQGKEKQYAFLKLFHPYNNPFSSATSVTNQNWNQNWYHSFMREKRDPNVAKAKFRISFAADNYGGTANAFPRNSVRQLVQFYDSFKNIDDIKEMNDLLLNGKFPKFMKAKRAQIRPSLIAHIGLISEQDHKPDFSRVFADVKFQSNQYK